MIGGACGREGFITGVDRSQMLLGDGGAGVCSDATGPGTATDCLPLQWTLSVSWEIQGRACAVRASVVKTGQAGNVGGL